MAEIFENKAASGISYFTPAQSPPAGTVSNPQPDGKDVPLLFQPIKIRGLEFQNRIFVSEDQRAVHPYITNGIIKLSPLCQYSAEDGALTAWHMAHLGGIIIRGPGLTFIEGTSVTPEGRITPQDAGLWSDYQIEPLRKVVEFAHSQGQKIAIQLTHAGRKASLVAPWLSMAAVATKELGGWPDDVVAPSAIEFSDAFPKPKELNKEGVQQIVQAFAQAAIRAVKAGIDVIELHAGHGYLLHSFLSPATNKREDEYGGSFENRTRLTLEVVDAVRKAIPSSMPLFLRISATDWLEESLPNEPSWRILDTVKLAKILADHGVDLLDVSSGGNHAKQRIDKGPIQNSPAYQAQFSEAVKRGVGDKLRVAAVGGITTGKIAEQVLSNEQADVVFIGRQFQRDPATVWTFARELGAEIKMAHQLEWIFRGRGFAIPEEAKEDSLRLTVTLPKS